MWSDMDRRSFPSALGRASLPRCLLEGAAAGLPGVITCWNASAFPPAETTRTNFLSHVARSRIHNGPRCKEP